MEILDGVKKEEAMKIMDAELNFLVVLVHTEFEHTVKGYAVRENAEREFEVYKNEGSEVYLTQILRSN